MARNIDDEQRNRGWGLHGHCDGKQRTVRKPAHGLPCQDFGIRPACRRVLRPSSSAPPGFRPGGRPPCFLPGDGISGIVYACSQRREQLLRQEGKAEIYRISGTEGDYEVSFALGTKHGVRSGQCLSPPRRSRGTYARWQPRRWSSTTPHACIAAYMVVGPTKAKPIRLSSLLSATDSGVCDAISSRCRGRARRFEGANDQKRASRAPSPALCRRSTSARAFCSVASILRRFLTMPASAMSRSTSASS